MRSCGFFRRLQQQARFMREYEEQTAALLLLFSNEAMATRLKLEQLVA